MDSKRFNIVWALFILLMVQSPTIGSKCMTLNTGELEKVLSKIAPLEEWKVASSGHTIKICWKFFRPDPEQLSKALEVIASFRGRNQWRYSDGCLQPARGKIFMPPASSQQAAILPPDDGKMLWMEDASADLVALAIQIEAQLGLADAVPLQFTESLLTKEGLHRSHPQFQDFDDGGQRTVFLLISPDREDSLEPHHDDIHLHFGPLNGEIISIFGEILKRNPSEWSSRPLNEGEREAIKNNFPMLWRVSDPYQDSYLTPSEAEALSRECQALLDRSLNSRAAVRGLDKLSRIAHWAATKHYGVLISAP